MTKDQLKAVLDRVLTWPPERQADLARVIERMQEQDSQALRLSEVQIAEVRRRLVDTGAENIPAEEVFKRIRSSGA